MQIIVGATDPIFTKKFQEGKDKKHNCKEIRTIKQYY